MDSAASSPSPLASLQSFQQHCRATHTAITNLDVPLKELKSPLMELLTLLNSELLTIPPSSFPPNHQAQWQGVKTELHRTSRLLQTEIIFWQSARTPERQQQCRQKVQTHLKQLAEFSLAIATWFNSDSSSTIRPIASDD